MHRFPLVRVCVYAYVSVFVYVWYLLYTRVYVCVCMWALVCVQACRGHKFTLPSSIAFFSILYIESQGLPFQPRAHRFCWFCQPACSGDPASTSHALGPGMGLHACLALTLTWGQ